jgi:long-chain fatty acid transport protein
VGGSIIRTSNTFTYDPAFAPTVGATSVKRGPANVAVPHAFLNLRVNPQTALAVGVFAPFGARLAWPVCDPTQTTAACTTAGTTNFEGRFTGYDNTLKAIYVQPTVAFQLVPNRVSIGAGLDYVSTTIDVRQRADLPALGLRGTDIADVKLAGDGHGWTGHVGVEAHLTPNTSVGVRYLHSVKVNLTGNATFVQIPTGTVFDPVLAGEFLAGGPLSNQKIYTTVEFPSQLVAGLAWRPIEPLRVLFDYQWTTWNKFDRFNILFQGGSPDRVFTLDYRNSNTFRLGGELTASDALTLRGGIRYNTAATPRATPFLPEGERNYFALGFGYRLFGGLQADGSFQLIDQPGRRGAVRPDEPAIGVYKTSGTIFGLTLSYRFGQTMTPAPAAPQ